MAGLKRGIATLDSVVASLVGEDREAFGRIFDVSVASGRLNPPEAMKPWLEQRFGSVDKVVDQRIVRVTNVVTMEEALFNPLRSGRPMPRERAFVSTGPGEDLLEDPLASTPEDTFGRVEGTYCITASNVAKYEGFHALVVFDEPDPLRFTREQVVDYVDTGFRWAERARASDPEARYFMFMWNCGQRAGASLRHGHAQLMLGRRRHYARVEHLRAAALSYRERRGTDYYEELFRVHRSLGCGFESGGVKVMAYLTPVKEKETVVMAAEPDKAFMKRLYDVLACFRDTLGVTSFNLVLWLPPLGDVGPEWRDFPAMARVVDRGDSASSTSDIGSMELYASSVISSDPFEVAEKLAKAVPGGSSRSDA
jgi:hypothetical protein